MQSCVPIGNAHNNVPLRAEEISRTGARSTRNGVCETLKVSNIQSGLRHLKMTRNDVKWQAKLKAELEYLGPRDMFILQLDASDMSRFGWPTPDIETFAGLDNKMLTIKLCFFFVLFLLCLFIGCAWFVVSDHNYRLVNSFFASQRGHWNAWPYRRSQNESVTVRAFRFHRPTKDTPRTFRWAPTKSRWNAMSAKLDRNPSVGHRPTTWHDVSILRRLWRNVSS